MYLIICQRCTASKRNKRPDPNLTYDLLKIKGLHQLVYAVCIFMKTIPLNDLIHFNQALNNEHTLPFWHYFWKRVEYAWSGTILIYHQLFDECWTADRSSHLLVSFQTPFKSTYLLQSYIYVHVFLLQTPENRVASWCANNSYSYDTFRNFSLIYLKLCLSKEEGTVIFKQLLFMGSSTS